MKLGKDTLITAILTLVTILTWVGIETYRTLSKEDIPKILKEQMRPLDDRLSAEVFSQLNTRQTFSTEELNFRQAPAPRQSETEIVQIELPETTDGVDQETAEKQVPVNEETE